MFNRKFFISLTICVLAVTSVVNSQKKYLSKIGELSLENYQQREQASKARLNLLSKIPSFGFSNLLADLAALEFMGYLGNDEERLQTGYSLLPEFLEIIVNHDPRFTEAQFMISPMVSLKAGTPEETVSLLNKSLSKLSPIINSDDRDKLHKPNYLWIYKAIDEILFLGDTKSARKSYQKAAEWSQLLGDSTRENSALQSIKFLEQDPDSKTVQVGAWFTVWTGTSDKEIRTLAKQNIERLGGRLEITEDGRVYAHPPKENNS